MTHVPGFKNCASCPHLLLMSDEHSHCLYCLGEAHLAVYCDSCRSFSSLTCEACLLPLCKFVEEAPRHCEAFDPGPTELVVHCPSLVVSAPPSTSHLDPPQHKGKESCKQSPLMITGLHAPMALLMPEASSDMAGFSAEGLSFSPGSRSSLDFWVYQPH